jgi:tetratricopeptide (TPR) repeat protein
MALYYANKASRAVDFARTAISSLGNMLPPWSDRSLKAANNLSVALLSLGNVDEALGHLYDSLVLASRNGNPEIIAHVCQNIWDNYCPKYLDFNQIKELYKDCLHACVSCSFIEPRLHQRAYLELATLSRAVGDSQTAEEAYLGLIALCQSISEKSQCEALYVYAKYLSEESRRAESIDMRRKELLLRRQLYGDADSNVLISLNELAIDLREIGELQEAEILYRGLVGASQQVLDQGDFQIGRALCGLAKTLERAGNLEEALYFSQQSLNHRLSHEGPDAWWANYERFLHARILHKLGRQPEAMVLLQEIHTSMSCIDNPDEGDSQLINDAAKLLRAVKENP